MWKMWKLTKKMVPANLRQKKCTAKWTHGSSKQHFRPLPWCSWTTVMLASHGHPSHKPVAFDALWCTRPLLKKKTICLCWNRKEIDSCPASLFQWHMPSGTGDDQLRCRRGSRRSPSTMNQTKPRTYMSQNSPSFLLWNDGIDTYWYKVLRSITQAASVSARLCVGVCVCVCVYQQCVPLQESDHTNSQINSQKGVADFCLNGQDL